MSTTHKKLKIKLDGMTCASCEVLIERKFRKLDGVEQVFVSHISGKATIHYSDTEPEITSLQSAIAEHGYQVVEYRGQRLVQEPTVKKNTKRDFWEIGGILVILLAGYALLKQLNILPIDIGISDNMSYGVVLGIGIVASLSTCMAVTGGLLLAVSARYSEAHPNLTPRQKFRPMWQFNLGRLAGYTVFGALIGALGSALTLSPKVNGIITIIASIAMIGLGLQLLHLFPGARRLQVRMPKWLSHKIHDISESDSSLAPLTLGSLTFFLPCGFTQALQLYVLSQGGAARGALVMGIFALGTLPALLSVGALSSYLKGRSLGYLLKFSGIIAIVVGVWNMNNGLTLTGNPFDVSVGALWRDASAPAIAQAADPNVNLINGRQVVTMKVDYIDYVPHQFTVQKGVPVDWVVDGSQAAGCMSSLLVPGLGIQEFLPRSGTKTISFTPTREGTYKFSCAMGMGTYGAAITVVDAIPAPTETDTTCDATVTTCAI